MIWGRLFGTLIGFKVGGPFGALTGFIVGFWLDSKARLWFGVNARARATFTMGRGASSQAERQKVFTESVVSLAAKLAKIDGVVTREEVDAFKAQFHIPADQMAAVAALYDEAKRDPSGYEDHARRLAQMFKTAPLLLSDILEALHRIALADGKLHPAELQFLENVARIFGLVRKSGFANDAGQMGDDDPYATLGVARGASMAEIKAAWRKLSREHHPDTLMAKGMPKEMIDMATHKMAAINAAYDRIRAERGEN